jgi:lipopolysaccharide transport system ATP-binding protein
VPARATRITVEGATKKFCRSLKRSLWYGLLDLGHELRPGSGGERARLRPGEFLALDDVSFEVQRGECVGLIGANGAGKSTLLKLLNGLVRPDAGRLVVRGRVGALIELGAGFNPLLTGRENVYVNAAVLGLPKRHVDAVFDEIVSFAGLAEFIDAPLQSYSSGMRVRLGFAVAAHLEPDVLLIDEVLAVGDVGFRMKCFENLLRLKREGATIVLVSHNMIDVSRVCDRVIVLEGGRVVHDGDVPGGIATYEHQILARAAGRRQIDTDAPVRIAGVELRDAAGMPRQEFQTGDDLVARVTLAAEAPLRGARLVVHVMAPALGVLGSFSSPHAAFAFDVHPPRTTLCFAIRQLPLLVGSYGLTLSLYGPEVSDFVDGVPMAATFKVVGPPTDGFGYGVCHAVAFEHDWELGEDAA